MRRSGKPIDIDNEEGKAMAAQLRAGCSVAEIATLHGLSARKVGRRLFSMRVFQEIRP
jgi:hypothetical protein